MDNKTYVILASRKNSQFGQKLQLMEVKVIDCHRNYMTVESLKRYNKKYAGAVKAEGGEFSGRPIRRINKDQAFVIVDKKTNRRVEWETIRRKSH